MLNRTNCICGKALEDIDAEAERVIRYVDPQDPCSVFLHGHPELLGVMDRLAEGGYSEWDVTTGTPVLLGDNDVTLSSVDSLVERPRRRLTAKQRRKLKEIDDAS